MWKIIYSKSADKFLKKIKYSKEQVKELLNKFICKKQGMDINIDCKTLKGYWKGYYRIRDNNIRIIFDIDFSKKEIFIDKIDFRGNIY